MLAEPSTVGAFPSRLHEHDATENTTEAIRNQTLGHVNSAIFHKYYTPQHVNVDLASAFLGKMSNDALCRLAGHMCLYRDPRALAIVRASSKAALARNSDLKEMATTITGLSTALKLSYPGQGWKSLAKERNDDRLKELEAMAEDRDSLKRSLANKIWRSEWKDYFSQAGTREIEYQARHGRPSDFELAEPHFALDERNILAGLLFHNDEVDKIDSDVLLHNRQVAIANMVSLCSKSVPLALTRPQNAPKSGKSDEGVDGDLKVEEDCVQTMTVEMCPWCFYNESLPRDARTKTFEHPQNLRRHIKGFHLQLGATGVRCPYRECGQRLEHTGHLRGHLVTQHSLSTGRI